MRRRHLVFLLCAPAIFAAEPPRSPAKPADSPTEELYEAGRKIFDEYAPPEIKEQYEFPSRERFDEFALRLQAALDKDDLGALAAYEPEARAALLALRVLPGYEDYADWLQVRLDYIEAAGTVTKLPPPPRTPIPGTAPGGPTAGRGIPYYDLWVSRMQQRARPSRADELMPALAAAFEAEGLSPALAWLAEAESTLDPAARSPAGAKGLFQLMPATAQSLGLSTFMPDERASAEKSAHAAARYLRALHGKFGDWPLAFAAYNAGEGRIRRLLAARGSRTFADVASALPAETRMYVPKVCATIAVRAGVSPEKLAAPRVQPAIRNAAWSDPVIRWPRHP
ncbi:MAG: Lytic transglycosylase catalytic [Verrucomicrobia bacterium]|nr:Lytic transglycosylase catalytic [Verrucomicrobiota bacterium]